MIPEWMNKWIEQLDDPITDTIINIPDIGDIHARDIPQTDPDLRHTSWCHSHVHSHCNCQNTSEETE